LYLQQAKLDVPGEAGATGRTDEAAAILADNFERLAGVVALGLQVEEPRLVSEELQWLERAAGARLRNDSSVTYVEMLTGAFAGGCRKTLSDEDCDVIDALMAQARSGMANLEPLLTDPRTSSHIESSTAHDNQ
jgi:hypothetical protein